MFLSVALLKKKEYQDNQIWHSKPVSYTNAT